MRAPVNRYGTYGASANGRDEYAGPHRPARHNSYYNSQTNNDFSRANVGMPTFGFTPVHAGQQRRGSWQQPRYPPPQFRNVTHTPGQQRREFRRGGNSPQQNYQQICLL